MGILNYKSMNFMENYLNGTSPVGYESENQKVWMEYLKPYVDEFITDMYGTAVGVIKGTRTGNEKDSGIQRVMIEAHADEIAWYVNLITADGLIKVKRNGGSDHQIAPSKRVNIHTKKSIIKGVFGWPAIHTRKGEDTKIKVETNFIDVGCSTKL